MKIHILYNFKQGPWGGGNQFLLALKNQFEKMGVYADNPETADAILFNSYQNIKKAIKLKKKYPKKVFIHRLGPVFYLHRGFLWWFRDKELLKISSRISQGVVFQSEWSFQQAKKLGFRDKTTHKVIYNAVNPLIFNKPQKKESSNRTRIISTSWSNNKNKGFNFLEYLDKNLDFTKYEMTFVGNTPIEFKNIKHIFPVEQKELSEILKKNDIFFSGMKNEACSNSLIEGISSGLPAVVLHSGSNKEVIGNGGEVFNKKEEIIDKIEKVRQNYNHYRDNIPEFSIEKISKEYHDFISNNV